MANKKREEGDLQKGQTTTPLTTRLTIRPKYLGAIHRLCRQTDIKPWPQIKTKKTEKLGTAKCVERTSQTQTTNY